jgi:hypothetical protein
VEDDAPPAPEEEPVVGAIPPALLVDEAVLVVVVDVVTDPPAPPVPVVTVVGKQAEPPPASNTSRPLPTRRASGATDRREVAREALWEAAMVGVLFEGSPFLAAHRGIFDRSIRKSSFDRWT